MKELGYPTFYSWVDKGVLKVSSVFTNSQLLEGVVGSIRLVGPWSIKVLPYRPNESFYEGFGEGIYGKAGGGEQYYTYLYDILALKDDPNIFLDQAGQPFFPLFWTKDPAIAIRVEKTYVEDWEEEFIIEPRSWPMSSCVDLVKKGDFLI
ncbi:hypothetical protein CR513_62114, partial [Mucuna pruriens]